MSRLGPRLAATIALASCAAACAAPSAPAPAAGDPSAWAAPGFGTIPFRSIDGRPLPVRTYRSRSFEPSKGPIWFVMHGASRDAERYVRAAAPVAERHGAFVLVPHFTREAYPKGADYTLGIGRTPGRSVYAEIERLFDAAQAGLGASRAGYHLFGHSAGAQFTHRLLTFVPDARVLGAVAANAGWYTLPADADPRLHAFPYGLIGSPVKPPDLRAFLATPFTVLVGERDTTTADTDDLVRGTPEAQAQGATRVERGRSYFRAGEAAARRLGVPFAWRFATVPRASHDAAGMIDSAGFLLFAPGESPCTPTAAADAGGLAIAEILADPPDGPAGDANGDGRRDPAEDEFVAIVNRGTLPVCLSGWTLGDARDPERHVFPLGRALAPGGTIVVFGGGVPTGSFGGAEVQWAEDGLSLSNAGDVLVLRDAGNGVARRVHWGDCDGGRCEGERWTGPLGGPRLAAAERR